MTRYLQKISQILAYDKQWNERVTRKEGTIFTVQIVHKSIEDNIESADILEDEPTSKELLKQILEVLIDIREEIRK
ncbi:MAG: hypothetical protein GX889_01425 [Clostridiales bacterium]|nr:hypothetical protein [Clostridiales bacterium]